MNAKKVEFLTSVDIRKAWSKEDKDFTPWVAQPDVLQELFDQCNIDVGFVPLSAIFLRSLSID